MSAPGSSCARRFGLLAAVFLLFGTGTPATDPPPVIKTPAVEDSRLDSITTETQYFSLLWSSDEQTFRKEFEVEFRFLLGKERLQAYDSLSSLVSRKAFVEQYWKGSNPNPLLPENDWLMEYLRRRAYARKHFSHSKPPYYDDRGKYYVKYGKPRFRHRDGGGFKRNRKFRTAFWVFQNESWSYENVRSYFVVHFVKVGNVFKEIKRLTEVAQRRRSNIDALSMSWLTLVGERSYISPELEQVMFEAQWFTDSRVLRERFDEGVKRPSVLMEENEWRRSLALRGAPAVAYDPLNAVNTLTFYDRISQFRGPDGNTRVDIAMLSPLTENLLASLSTTGADSIRVEYSALFRDKSFDPVDRSRRSQNVSIAALQRAAIPNAVGLVTLRVPPQVGEITLQVRNESEDDIGFRRGPVTIRTFHGPGLLVSDIQFFAQVTTQELEGSVPFVTREGITLIPYPYAGVDRFLSLYVYFEIYNILSSGISEMYEIEYTIRSAQSPRSLLGKIARSLSDRKTSISASYARKVEGDTAKELIGIDLGKLAKGKYLLVITVRARNGEEIRARAEREIVVGE